MVLVHRREVGEAPREEHQSEAGTQDTSPGTPCFIRWDINLVVPLNSTAADWDRADLKDKRDNATKINPPRHPSQKRFQNLRIPQRLERIF